MLMDSHPKTIMEFIKSRFANQKLQAFPIPFTAIKKYPKIVIHRCKNAVAKVARPSNLPAKGKVLKKTPIQVSTCKLIKFNKLTRIRTHKGALN